jgi:hypothetical protein
MWRELQELCYKVRLSDENDRCIWLLEKNGKFRVKSMYTALKTKQTGCEFKDFWVVKVPLRVKVFLWLVCKNSILTRDNLRKRGWEGGELCCFCCEKESIDHLMFRCPVARYA